MTLFNQKTTTLFSLHKRSQGSLEKKNCWERLERRKKKVMVEKKKFGRKKTLWSKKLGRIEKKQTNIVQIKNT